MSWQNAILRLIAPAIDPTTFAVIGLSRGEVAEWLNALLSKSSKVQALRGFESLSPRHFNKVR